jgi:hypothetical protein
MSATPKQRRSQAAFGAASKAWSENHPLSQEQRAAWYASAAKIESKPRLWQSGFLTAQLHFVGINSRKERWGLPPGARATRAGKKDGRRQGASYEILCTSGATPEAFRAHAGDSPGRRRISGIPAPSKEGLCSVGHRPSSCHSCYVTTESYASHLGLSPGRYRTDAGEMPVGG